MEIKDIRRIIIEFTEEYRNSKDGGNSFVRNIAKEFNSYSEKDRKTAIDFLVDELQKTNYDDISLISIDILGEMRAYEAAKCIYDLYNNYLINKKDFDWEKYIIGILLTLRYDEADSLYTKHIRKFEEKPDNGYLFFLGVLYCRANKRKGMDFLSDYFCKHITNSNREMLDFIENRMGYLIINFIDISEDYVLEIIKQTIIKNRSVGLQLKDAILGYLNSDNIPQDEKIKMNELIRLIQTESF